MGDFNTTLIAKERSSRQKINKETKALNDTLDQLGLIDIYGELHPKTIDIIFFPQVHMEDSLEQITSWVTQSSLGKFQKTKIIQESFLTTTL